MLPEDLDTLEPGTAPKEGSALYKEVVEQGCSWTRDYYGEFECDWYYDWECDHCPCNVEKWKLQHQEDTTVDSVLEKSETDKVEFLPFINAYIQKCIKKGE